MTPEELAAIRERHERMNTGREWSQCDFCSQAWPCDTARALAHIDALTAAAEDDAAGEPAECRGESVEGTMVHSAHVHATLPRESCFVRNCELPQHRAAEEPAEDEYRRAGEEQQDRDLTAFLAGESGDPPSVPDEGPDIETQCDRCGGDGWFIDADPLPSGEPGEPYQVECGDCGGTGVIYQPARPAAAPALDDTTRALLQWAEGWDGESGAVPTPEGMNRLWMIVAAARARLSSEEPTDDR